MTEALIQQSLVEGDLTLRPWQPGDADRLVAAWTDPTIAEWNAVPPVASIDVAKRWIQGVERRLERRLSLDWAIETAGVVIGEVGLSGFSAAHGGALIGYWLLAEARSAGRATAAVSAVTRHGFDQLGLDVVVARCRAANTASQRVAARAGYVMERVAEDGDQLWVRRKDRRE